jgi:hypothetical protein
MAALLGLHIALTGVAAHPLPAAQTGAVQLAAPAAGEIALELIGKTEIRETSLTYYGYVAAVDGLPPETLFVDVADRTESAARLVYFGSADTLSRTEVAGFTLVDAVGTAEFHVHERGGSGFEVPESFFGGPIAATAEIRVQYVLDTGQTERDTGVMTAYLAFDSAPPFALDDAEYQLGYPGLRLQWSSVGAVTPPSSLRSPIVVAHAGPAAVVGELASAPPVEPEPTPAPAATPDPACVDAARWFEATTERLERVGAVGELVPDGATLEDLDADAVRQLAAALNELAGEQRDVEIPADMGAANRLVVTALGTYGRALNLMASAAASGSASVFDRALALIDEARASETEAREALAEIAARCAFGP